MMRPARSSGRIITDRNQKIVFDYKDPEILGKFVSDRGKIIGRSRTGLSAKQQRRLAKAVKRARYLGLLPFTTKVL